MYNLNNCTYCDRNLHQRCDGSVIVMEQQGAERYLCSCAQQKPDEHPGSRQLGMPTQFNELGPTDGVSAETVLMFRAKCPECGGEEYQGNEFWPPCPACGGSGRTPLLPSSQDADPVIHNITIDLCDICLMGIGGECHSPGCIFWMCAGPTEEAADRFRFALGSGTTPPPLSGSPR